MIDSKIFDKALPTCKKNLIRLKELYNTDQLLYEKNKNADIFFIVDFLECFSPLEPYFDKKIPAYNKSSLYKLIILHRTILIEEIILDDEFVTIKTINENRNNDIELNKKEEKVEDTFYEEWGIDLSLEDLEGVIKVEEYELVQEDIPKKDIKELYVEFAIARYIKYKEILINKVFEEIIRMITYYDSWRNRYFSDMDGVLISKSDYTLKINIKKQFKEEFQNALCSDLDCNLDDYGYIDYKLNNIEIILREDNILPPSIERLNEVINILEDKIDTLLKLPEIIRENKKKVCIAERTYHKERDYRKKWKKIRELQEKNDKNSMSSKKKYSIQRIAKELNISRRKVYDIINYFKDNEV
ncbi:MAG: hypothetical protein J6F30_08675 [Cellulosilyticum sp.]|nr:hypothetical protein [Cellulosilyticum sp.]